MATKIPTPVFDDSIRYDQYDTEVKAWCEVTGVDKEKRALVLVLAMPERKTDFGKFEDSRFEERDRC